MAQPKCSVEGCLRLVRAHGFCGLHYGRLQRYGSPLALPPRPGRGPTQSVCTVEGCGLEVYAKLLCRKHHGWWLRHRDEVTLPLTSILKPQFVCLVPGCGLPVEARHLCSSHYSYYLRRGGVSQGKVRVSALARDLGLSRQRVDQLVHPDKARARQMVNYALESGRLVKPHICMVCGEQKEPSELESHHPDYNYPLAVIWVCDKCHSTIPVNHDGENAYQITVLAGAN